MRWNCGGRRVGEGSAHGAEAFRNSLGGARRGGTAHLSYAFERERERGARLETRLERALTRYANNAPMARRAAKYWMIVMTTIRVRRRGDRA